MSQRERPQRVDSIAEPCRNEGSLPGPCNRFLNALAQTGCLLFALILLYSVILLPLSVSRSWLTSGIKSAAILFLFGLFLLLLCIPMSALGIVRRFAERISWKHIFITALLLRLGWVLLSRVEQFADFKDYDQMALEILQGQYIINPIRQTGPSLFFALHYHLLGYNPLYPQISIAFLSALQTLLVYKLLLHETSSRTIAIVSSGLLAVWPEHIIYTNLLGGDVLYGTAVLLAIWFISTSRSSAGLRSVALILGAGLTLGVSHWIRPTAPLFILIAALFLLLDPNTLWARIRNTVCLLAGVMIPIAPIMWLNQSVIGFPSPMVSQQGGWSMLVGTNVASHGWYNTEDHDLLDQEVARRGYNSDEHPVVFRYRVAREMAIKRLRDEPVAFLCMALRYKIPDLWRPGGLFWSLKKSRLSLLYRPICGVAAVYHVLMLLLCSAAVLRRCNPGMLQWNITTLYIYTALASILAHLFLEVQPRYHHMFLPLIAMYGVSFINGPKTADPPATPVNNLTKKTTRK